MNMQKTNPNTFKYTYKGKRRGVTLFEVLLYVGLFSVISISTISVMTSVSKTFSQIEVSTKRSEVQLMFYEILRSKIDTYEGVNFEASALLISDLQTGRLKNEIENNFTRILRAYPQFTLDELNIHQETNLYNETTIKIEYTLKKIFTDSLYTETLSISLI